MCTNNRHTGMPRTCLLFVIAAAAAAATGCGPVLATGPNAVGVHLAGVSYPSSPDDPSDEVHLQYAAGALQLQPQTNGSSKVVARTRGDNRVCTRIQAFNEPR